MTEEERLNIVEWVETNLDKMQVLSLNRLQYKIFINDKILPNAIWRIKKRLIEREGLHEYRQDPIFHDIVISILNGGIIHPHTDPNGLFDGTIHCRFNVFIQVPENFDTYYGGYLVEAKNGHYVMCRSGLDTHWSNMNTKESRISLSFGYLLPQKKVDELYNTQAIPNKGIPSVMVKKLYHYLGEKLFCIKNGV